MLNIGAKAKVNNVRTNRENKTDEEEEERQTRGNMAAELSIDDHPQLYVRPLRFTERYFPLSLSLWIIFSSRIVDHVRSKYSSKRMSEYNIYTNDRNTSGTNKRNKGKRREWLVAEIVALHFSLTKIRVISSSLYILHSREIFYRSTPHLFYRPSAFPH